MPAGIILKGIGGFYYVALEDGVYECKARGIFRKDNIIPLPGDRVSVKIIDQANKTGSIEEILPREMVLTRPAVANVNQLIAVIAIKQPDPDFLLLDKLLVTAEKKGIKALICINKIDLDSRKEYEEIIETYKETGYDIVLTSSKLEAGYDCLKQALQGKISVLAGQSGVGKSTILNRIMNEQIMETGEISEKIERGRHTTRHAELIMLETGGYLVDTPGFSSFELSEIKHDELWKYYPDFVNFAERCRFIGCNHAEEPGCGVKSAVSEGLIDDGRYKRYMVLYNLLKKDKSIKYLKK